MCKEGNENMSLTFHDKNKQNDNVPLGGTHLWLQQLPCQSVYIQTQGQSIEANFRVRVLTQVPDGELEQSVWHHRGSMEARQHHSLALHFDELQS